MKNRLIYRSVRRFFFSNWHTREPTSIFPLLQLVLYSQTQVQLISKRKIEKYDTNHYEHLILRTEQNTTQKNETIFIQFLRMYQSKCCSCEKLLQAIILSLISFSIRNLKIYDFYNYSFWLLSTRFIKFLSVVN